MTNPKVPIDRDSTSAPSLVWKNILLNTLPADECERLAPHLHRVAMEAKQRVHKQGEPIRHVYFPEGGAYSLIKTMKDGHTAEIATVGNEGMVGVGVWFGDDISAGDAVVQVPSP